MKVVLIRCFTAFWELPLNGWLETQFPKMVTDSSVTIWNYEAMLRYTEGVTPDQKAAVAKAIAELKGVSFALASCL